MVEQNVNLAGAYLVLGQVQSSGQDGTAAGIGWIAAAFVVFASWKPLRAQLGIPDVRDER